ncbi:hypothetical protein [Micromonospora sp. WMMD1274]|uniref:hypothetical protein n=1 Tax=Micromonospora sp. WMMD1274 TaxID=3404116 RepID=UPI003B92EF25
MTLAPARAEPTDAEIGEYLLAARGRQWIAGAVGDERDPWSLLLRGGDRAEQAHRARQYRDVYRSPAGCWVVTAYDRCAELLGDPRMGLWYPDPAPGRRSAYELAQPLLSHLLSLDRAFMCLDPAEYRNLTAWTDPVLGAEPVEHHVDRLTALCRAELARLPERFDLIRDYAQPAAAAALAELIELPVPHRPTLAAVSAAAAVALDAVLCPPQRPVALGLRSAVETAHEILGRERDTAAVPPRVLTGVAGVEMAAQLTANVLLALLRDPAGHDRVRAEPQRIPALVEQALCDDPPVRVEHRVALADVPVAGQVIAAGSEVVLWVEAANPGRGAGAGNGRVRPPLTVDAGLYTRCVAPFARVVATAAVTAAVSSPYPVRPDGEPLRRLRSPVTAAHTRIPVAVTAIPSTEG